MDIPDKWEGRITGFVSEAIKGAITAAEMAVEAGVTPTGGTSANTGNLAANLMGRVWGGAPAPVTAATRVAGGGAAGAATGAIQGGLGLRGWIPGLPPPSELLPAALSSLHPLGAAYNVGRGVVNVGKSAWERVRGLFGGATGAIVTQPTLSWVGEAGPEAIMPLSSAPGASPLPGGATTIVLELNGRELGRAVVNELNDVARKSATSLAPLRVAIQGG